MKKPVPPANGEVLTAWDWLFPFVGLILSVIIGQCVPAHRGVILLLSAVVVPLLMAMIRAGVASLQYPHMDAIAQALFGIALISLMIFEISSSLVIGVAEVRQSLVIVVPVLAYFVYLMLMRVSLRRYFGIKASTLEDARFGDELSSDDWL